MNKGLSVLPGLLLALNCGLLCRASDMVGTSVVQPVPTPTAPRGGSDAVGTWTLRQPLPTANQLNGVAYGDGKYVAVGELGTIIVSGDGTNWSQVASHTKASLAGVACGDRGFVAVGENGTILRSIHGINWLRCPSPTKAWLGAVTYGGGRFVAVGDAILSSADGFHWIQHTNPAAYYPLTGIAYGNGQFVGVANASTVTSPDGTNWTVHPIGETVVGDPDPPPTGITYADGKFVAVGDGFAESSVDGINWVGAPAEAQLAYLWNEWNVAYGNGVFAAVGSRLSATSQDGDTWFQQFLSAGNTLQGVTFGNGQFVAVGWEGAIMTSADGLNWASQAKGMGANLSGVAFGNGQYVTVGAEGSVLHSGSGAKWNRVEVQTTKNLTCVTFGDGQFVAGGVAGTIITSGTGTNWVILPPVGTNTIRSIAYGNGRFVAAGWDPYYIDGYGDFRSYGILLESIDGTNWRQTQANENTAFSSITFGNGRFVACVTVGGDVPLSEAWVSKNGVDWREYAMPSWANVVGFGNGRFIAAGYGEKFLSSIDGLSWTIQKTPFVDDYASGVAYGGGKFIVCGQFGTLLSSADSVRWTRYQPASSPGFGFFGVCCGEGSCVAVGWGGAIFQARLVPGY